MSRIPFINLHSHSGMSYFDALSMPYEHYKNVYELGEDAMAITDHGNMNAFPYQLDASKALEKETGKKFKSIFGSEMYYVPCLDQWRREYELYKEEKKNKNKEQSEEEDAGIFVEDEGGKTENKKTTDDRRSHLLLLAQNEEGLYNLFKLISLSYEKERFFRYPRIDFKLLSQYHKGLIATNACLGGVFGKIMRREKERKELDVYEEIRKECVKLVDLFGDRFYGELQWNGMNEQHELNKIVIQLSKEFNFKLISTVDSHYPRQEFWKDREIYKKLGWLGKTGSQKPKWTEEPIPETIEELKYELYPKNGDLMFQEYKKYSERCEVQYDDEMILESIKRTKEIAFEIIGEVQPDRKMKLPSFFFNTQEKPEIILTKKCIEGLKKKNLHNRVEYKERLKQELKVIKDKNFSEYFLAVEALVKKAKEFQLLGCSRGSVAGSMCAYCLDITTIDPIRWNTQFERFLTKDSDGMPDIDIDHSDPTSLKENFKKEWGENAVIQITNFNTLQARSLIKDVAKLYDIPYHEANEVTSKMLTEAVPLAKQEHGITSGVYSPTFEELKKYSPSLNDFLKKYPFVETHVNVLKGQIRSLSTHAAGTIILDKCDEKMPLIAVQGKKQTPWCEGQKMRHLEPLGFIKFDLLGLATLRMIEVCIEQILKRKTGKKEIKFEEVKEFHDTHLHPDKMNFEDKDVWKNIFHDGKFIGIFQFFNEGIQELCKKVKPNNIFELSDINAMYRPGPLGNGVDTKYIGIRNGEERINYIHPIMEEILGPSQGQCIYQEQISSLAHKLGKNITLDEGNKLRKLLTKKGIKEVEEQKKKIWKKFREGCKEKQISEEDTEELIKTLELFGQYGFNKCLSEDTEVETEEGRKNIKEVNIGEKVNSKNGFVKVKDVIYQGKKKVYEITTSSGKKLKCTMNHKLETKFGMKALRAIGTHNDIIVTNDLNEEYIVGIQEIGYEDTYDLEIVHPSHTFYANDISVSNSHSLAYSIISYQCAWLLNYYPIEWCVAFLDKEPEMRKEKAISLVKSLGIEIEPININTSYTSWEISNKKLNTIIQPFLSIKGVGSAAIGEILKYRPFDDVEQLLYDEDMNYSKVNKKVLDALFKSNALNSIWQKDKRFNHSKHFWLSCIYDRPKTFKKLLENIENYKEEKDFTFEEKIEAFAALTGEFPIGMVMSEYALKRLQEKNIPGIGNFDCVNNEIGICWGIPRKIEHKKTKNDKPFYEILMLDDSFQLTRVKCWAIKESRDKIWVNHPYIVKVRYDRNWGYSTSGPVNQYWKMIG